MNKNILYLNFSGGWGGLEIFAYNLFLMMSRAGHNIYFAVEQDTMLCNKLRASEFSSNIIEFKNVSALNFYSYWKLRSIIKKNNIKIIHTFKSSDIRFAVISGKIFNDTNLKVVHHLQMLPTKPRRDLIHSFIYKYLDKLCVITEQMKQEVLRFWPVDEKIIELVYHCIDASLFERHKNNVQELKKKYALPVDKKIIGIVGQVTEGKGQHIVLNAFKKLTEKYNDIFLVIVGAAPKGEEAYFFSLQNFVNDNGLTDKVKMTGYCDNIPELMCCFDIFAFASRNETFGLVLIEAMAAGCITIGTAAGGVPEIISHEENGFLYEPFNDNALYLTFDRALKADKSELLKIRQNANNTLKTKFSVERFIIQLKNLYNKNINVNGFKNDR